MRQTCLLIALTLFVPLGGSSQTQAPSMPLGAGRPETPGIMRTTLKDDPKVTVTRVRFAPGAAEVLHTHPYDVILVPVAAGPAEVVVAEKKISTWKAGETEFVGRDVPHQVRNLGKQDFELIAIAVK